MRVLFAALVLALVAIAQDEKPAEEPKKPKTGAEIEIPDPGIGIEDSAVARREVARFETEMRAAKEPAQEVALIERLGGFDHPVVFKALTRRIKDRELTVAVAAVVAVARQSTSRDSAGRTLLGALKTEKRTDVLCACFVGMGRLGYDHKTAVNEATKYFQRDTKETHKAATRYFGYIKHKDAFRMLAEKLDEPTPKNPNDPNNPPASYWKERWEEWSSNVPYTRWALAQLVEGETFELTSEAKEWAETEGAKHGIKW